VVLMNYKYHHQSLRWYPHSFEPADRAEAYALPVQWLFDIESWCADQFGSQQGDRWRRDIWTFRFHRETDALAFRIRWCGAP
jgi:hypothetical protein